jgi:hypothetical protein
VLRNVLIVLSGVAATVAGLELLLHPTGGWYYGAARKADAAPVFGVGLLAWPLLLVAVGARRAWNVLWFLWLEREVRRQRNRPSDDDRSGCRT